LVSDTGQFRSRAVDTNENFKFKFKFNGAIATCIADSKGGRATCKVPSTFSWRRWVRRCGRRSAAAERRMRRCICGERTRVWLQEHRDEDAS
jgi:hypothetical protein